MHRHPLKTTAVTAALLLAVTAAAAPPTAASAADSAPAAAQAETVDLSNWSSWQPQWVAPKGDRNALATPANVTTRDGNLVIKTKRHCVPSGNWAPYLPTTFEGGEGKALPAAKGECGTKANTIYSTGRVHWPIENPGSRFSLTFRAKLTTNAPAGMRQALWMTAGGYCDGDSPASISPLSEFDALEWYSAKPGQATASTHLTCDSSREEGREFLTQTRVVPASQTPRMSAFHNYTVTRANNKVTYSIDGQRIATHVCGEGLWKELSDEKCNELMSQPYLLIMQGEVFKYVAGKTGKYNGPRPGVRFPVQELEIAKVTLKLG